MKFYKAKSTEIGEGVDATVVFHKDNGDEIVFVRSGAESFETANPKAKECSAEEADKLLAKAKIKTSVPTRRELRKEKRLTDGQILEDIESEETPTIAVTKDESGEGQTLTYFEEMPIASTEDFFKAQELQTAELAPIAVEAPQETII